jgi:hypothetical protein
MHAQPFRLGCEKAGTIMRLRTANAASRLMIFITPPCAITITIVNSAI